MSIPPFSNSANPIPASQADRSVSESPGTRASGPNHRGLRLTDAISIIVGTIIGAAIFKLPPLVAMQVDSLTMLAVAWIGGGAIAFCGSLCFAELTTAYNEDGGDYVYLRQAFGRSVAFLFAWSAGWINRPANVAAMAITFASFADGAIPGVSTVGPFAAAALAVTVLAGLNLMGIVAGKRAQNVLTVCKVGGLLLLCGVGLLPAGPSANFIAVGPTTGAGSGVVQSTAALGWDAGGMETTAVDSIAAEPAASGKKDWTLALSGVMMALVFVLYTFGGWNDISFVAAEIENPQVNLPRALLIGLAVVTFVYLLVNWVMISNLGLAGLAASQNAPADVITTRMQAWGWGPWVGSVLGILVSVSCLGAVNAMLITSPRIYYAAGQEHPVFAWLGQWNARLQTPVRALLAQTAATLLLLIVCAGLTNATLQYWNMPFSIFADSNPFEELVAVSSPLFWLFLALVGIALIVLRRTDPDRPRPIRTWGYPLTPLVFITSSLFMVVKSCQYIVERQFFISGGLVLVVFATGVVLSVASRTRGPSQAKRNS